MNKAWVWVILLIAAALEAGGDALVRVGLRSAGGSRLMALAAGAVVLFGYGLTVNAPDWDFGKLIGVYIVFFFVVAQVLGWVVFRQAPTGAMLIGGGLIVAGGLVMGVAK